MAEENRFSSIQFNERFDIVVLGASGFTGAEVCVTLAQQQCTTHRNSPLKWALAGRSASKLAAVRARCEKAAAEATGGGKDPAVAAAALPSATPLLCDVGDAASLEAVAGRARLVLNCTGPYRFFGLPVVAACVSQGSHCMDLCGEPEFYDRAYLHHHAAAVEAGVLVCHAAAWDSVPADLGTILAARRARELGLVSE